MGGNIVLYTVTVFFHFYPTLRTFPFVIRSCWSSSYTHLYGWNIWGWTL